MEEIMNTPENKARFFAQYWGQVWRNNEDFGIWNGLYDISDCALELKPLSSISDEDAIQVGKIIGWGNYPIGCERNDIMAGKSVAYWLDVNQGDFENFISAPSWEHLISYLRSNGYALPWMGIAVDQQVEFSWVKLITQ